MGFLGAAFARIVARPRLAALLVGLPALIFFALSIRQSSVAIGGVRYFWLDDDQMISMRYARNLASGQGLVFNPGERVEGYTNPLWTVLLAGIHLLPLHDAHTSLVAKLVALCVVVWVVWLSCELLLEIEPAARPLLPVVTLAVAYAYDITFWAANGYETPLLTALFTFAALRIVRERGRASPLTVLAIGVLPLVRSDAFHLSAMLGLLAIALSERPRAAAARVSFAALLPVAHLLWRRSYYGEWLPNTFHLKVSGLQHRVGLGLAYVETFALRYALFLAVAGVGAYVLRDRFRAWTLAAAAAVALYCLSVGGDVFAGSRFFAAVVPVLMVAALSSIARVEAPAARHAAITAFALAAIVTGVHRPSDLDDASRPYREGVIAGVALRDHARNDTTVAVVAAGNVPYFSHLRSIDTLGKADRAIAHSSVVHPGIIGHTKFDYEEVLGVRKPEWVVALYPLRHPEPETCAMLGTYVLALPCSHAFQRWYANQPIKIPGMTSVMLFAREGTEGAAASEWDLQLRP
ncbi:MAG: hypothetical protein ACXWVM_29115 [Polyangiales bacterium]